MCKALVDALVCWLSTTLLAQYPPPLPHTPQDHPAQRVLLIVISSRDIPLNDADRLSLAVSQITGKRLTYAELTGKVGETTESF